MTPEGRVKNEVKKILKKYEPYVFGNWPVQNGMGTPMLDYVGCCAGKYFSIETKAFGRKLTPRQHATMQAIHNAGGMTFVIEGEDDLALGKLDWWLLETSSGRAK